MPTCLIGALLAAALPVLMQSPARPLTATVSRAAIQVGDVATVTFTGGQLDGPGGHSVSCLVPESIRAVAVRRLNRAAFSLQGVAPCDCTLVFTDGRNKAAVRIRVIPKSRPGGGK